MEVLIVVFLAIVQALTEFLPISSSAHLLLLPWIFGFPNPGLAFDAAIHVGTAAALVVFFWRDFVKLIKTRNKLLWYILVASIPAALLGFFGDKVIEEYLHSSIVAPLIVGIGLIFFGLILLVIDRASKKEKDISQMSWRDSLVVGFAQALALVPGTSRSGITISAGLLLGYTREEAARFSFILATPISLGAGIYKLTQLIADPAQSGVSIGLTIIGILVAFLVGLAVIKWLLDYLKKHSLLVFVIYRVVFGLLIIALWFMRN